MGAVALHDPEGDRLIRLAESLGGAEKLSEGERWRLANTLDRRRMLEARASEPGGRSDALDNQANERRFAASETHAQWATWMLREILPQVIGESIGEAEQRADAEAKKLVDELRGEINAKNDALFSGFEQAVAQLRDEDRRALLTTVRETMSDAESRIDEHLAAALEKTWERCELEIALVRDELLDIVAQKKYGQLTTDDDPAKLAERAIAELRKRMISLEAEGARATELAGVANQLAALEGERKTITKKLLVRCATSAVLLKEESARVSELSVKFEHLKTELERLIDELLMRKVIS